MKECPVGWLAKGLAQEEQVPQTSSLGMYADQLPAEASEGRTLAGSSHAPVGQS